MVGLDVGSSAVRAVELTKSKTGYQMTGFAYEPLGPDSVVDGAIMDSRAVANAIKTDSERGQLQGKGNCCRRFRTFGDREARRSARCNRAGHRCVAAVRCRAVHSVRNVGSQHRLPGCWTSQKATNAGMEVLLVAAKKDKIQNHTNVISMAGRPRTSWISTPSRCRTHSRRTIR